MAEDSKNTTEPNNFYVRLKPRVARWLRSQVSEDATSVPAVIRDVLDKEYILEKERKRREAGREDKPGRATKRRRL